MMSSGNGLMKFMAEYDRRWIYLMIFVIVTAVLIKPIGMPIAVSPDTKKYYSVISNIKDGDRVLVTLDTEFSGYMEIQSGIIASVRILVEKHAKIAIAVGHPEATGIPELVLAAIDPEMKQANYQYGRDYVNLGYILPNEAAVAALAQDFKGTIKQDYFGKSIAGTFLDYIDDWSDWQLIADFTTGLGTTGLRSHFALRGTPMIINCIGVMIPTEKPYVDTGIYKALLGSMRGGAELEYLTNHPGPGITAMDAFTLGHYMLIIFIIIGNIGYFGYSAKRKGVR